MRAESFTSRSCIQIWLERDSRATCIGSLSWAEPSQSLRTFRQLGSYRALHWPSTSEIRAPASRQNAPTPSRTRANVRIPSNQNNLAVSTLLLRHTCRYAETESDLLVCNRFCIRICCLMSAVGGQTAHDPFERPTSRLCRRSFNHAHRSFCVEWVACMDDQPSRNRILRG